MGYPSPEAIHLPLHGLSGRWQDTDNWRKCGFNRACEEAGLFEEQEDKTGDTILKTGVLADEEDSFADDFLIEISAATH